MRIDSLSLNELTPTADEVSCIRQAHAEAQKNASGGLAAAWEAEAARLADLLAFLEKPQPSAVSPKLVEWALRFSVRAGRLSDFDTHIAAEATEIDAENAFRLLAESKQSGDIASALASAASFVLALYERQKVGAAHGN